ncbi:MAG: hypothetical protein KatS3mg082_2455 [Nitrospiraceae bacterium]|nr:MAG: hypothetical protein KatS3mg082_2455 [Nitrospiraceae bacterium]
MVLTLGSLGMSEKVFNGVLALMLLTSALQLPSLWANPPRQCCGSDGCTILYDWPCGSSNGCSSPNGCCTSGYCPVP